MKRSLLSVSILLIVLICCVYAVPSKISFQGVLKDSAGNPITGSRTVVFTIYGSPTGADSSWSETQTISVEAGLYNVKLGSVHPFDLSDFDGNTKYLAVSIGGSELLPRVVILTVPYAYRAEYADTAGSSGGTQNAVLFNPTTIQATSAANAIWVRSTITNKSAVSIEAIGERSKAVYGYAYTDSSNGCTAGVFTAIGAGKTTGISANGSQLGGSFNSDGGHGIMASSSLSVGEGIGGYFSTSADEGRGVYGSANNDTSNKKLYGGYFEAASSGSSGIGVYGTGDVAGGSFEATSGYGVYGRSANYYGMKGESNGVDPYAGVYGLSTHSTGRGVLGVNQSGGRAVRGESSSGAAISGWSTSGYAGEFVGGLGVLIPDATGATTPAAGTIRWNSNAGKFQGYTGAVWVDFH